LAAAPLATVRVSVEEPGRDRDVPVQVDLDALPVHADQLVLHEVIGEQRTRVPAQISSGPRRALHWLVRGGDATGANRVFELTAGAGGEAAAANGVEYRQADGVLTVHADGQDLL